MHYSLSQNQKQHVIDQTRHYVLLANQLMNLKLSDIDVLFDLKGKSSGMFVVKQSQAYIRYNEMVFSRYFEDAAINTVAHEVAHYVVFSLCGIGNAKPHGKEWKYVMSLFGLKAEVTSSYDISEIPLKQQKRHRYACDCMTHELSTTRHNRVQFKKMVYHCRKCQQPLKSTTPSP